MGGMEPQADAKELGMKCGISCSMAGWYTERHPKLDPVATMTDGVFVAGVCQGPKDIPASVAQGAAAAARVQGMITKGEVMIEPIVASIDEESCSGCRICNNMCPYNAIEFDEEKKVSRVITALVQGLRHLRGRLPRRRHHRRALQQRANFRRDRRHFVGCEARQSQWLVVIVVSGQWPVASGQRRQKQRTLGDGQWRCNTIGN